MRHGSGLRTVLCVLAMAWPLSAAAGLPENWQILTPSQQESDAGLPSVLRTPLLGKAQQPLQQVDLLVTLPFEQVVPVVQAALAPLGNFQAPVERTRIAYMDGGWGAVMMARRPQLKREYIERFIVPGLQQAVVDGALLAEEIPARIARLERDRSFDAQSDKLTALQPLFASWSASAEQRHGLAGRAKSVIEVRVMQVDAAIGQPATAIRLRRIDDWPNPKGGIVGQLRALADFNILSSGPSARLSRTRVPASVFTPVFDALAKLPNASLQLGAHAGDWIPTRRPVASIIEPRRSTPDGQQRLEATRVLAIDRRLDQQTFEVSDMRPLQDGSVLLVQSYPFTLMHWSGVAAAPPRTLWKAQREHVRGWSLSTDPQGRAAYLVSDGKVLRFDSIGQALEMHPLAFDNPALLNDSYVRFMHDGNGVPLAYRHDRSEKRDTLALWAPVTQPLVDGARWDYARRFAAPRADVMKQGFPGNTQLKPVQWDGPRLNPWVEDAAGLTELDAQSGRVLRALPLPRRFGAIDTQDDAGIAQWIPAPFGSTKGDWIAVGFVLMDGGRRNPGMHVVDVASGRVRYSLSLPGLDSLQAAAGSPDGRLLALGSNGGGVVAAVWNLENGQSLSLQATGKQCWDLRQLHWSASGDVLWGLCGDALVQWRLPPPWQSAVAD